MSGYCSYCGYGWLKHKCQLCGDSISTCGCDCARDVCEEHFCVDCGEAFFELNDEGLCADCAVILAAEKSSAGFEDGFEKDGTWQMSSLQEAAGLQ